MECMGSTADDDTLSVLPVTAEELLLRVGPVVIDGHYLLAEDLDEMFRSFAKSFSSLGRPEVAMLCESVAGMIQLAPSRHQPQNSNDPSQGYKSKYPIWSTFIGDALYDGPRSLDPVRLLVILVLTSPEHEIGESIVKSVRPRIELLERKSEAPVLEAVLKFAESVNRYIADPDQREHAEASVNQLAAMGLLKDGAENGLRRLLSAAGSAGRARKPRTQTRSTTYSTQRTPVPGTHVHIATLAKPRSYQSGDDEPPQDQVTLVGQVLLDAGRVYREAELGRIRQIVATQLHPASDLALQPAETTLISNWLLREARVAISQGAMLKAEACAVWLCCLLTCRGVEQLIAEPALSNSKRSSKSVFDGTFEYWISRLPESVNLWAPRQQHAHNFVDLDTATRVSITLPIPLSVTNLLGALDSAGPPRRTVFQSPPEKLSAACAELRAELRASIAPRFSQTRLRMAIPIEIVSATGEICLSQWIAGQRFALSDAPLHYYATTTEVIRDAYEAAVRKHFGPFSKPPKQLSFEAPEVEAVGATLARLPENIYAEFIGHLRTEIVAEATMSPIADRLRRRANAITRYTAWMLVAAAAHRVTHWLADLSLLHIHPGGWAVIRDKETEGVGALRIVVLPAMVIEQIQLLRLVLAELADHLSESRKTRGAAMVIRSCVDGSGPLFRWVTPSYTVQRLDTTKLRKLWLKDRGIPGNFLRARSRIAMTNAGVHPQWIYWQMGHAYLSEEPFGAECAYSLDHFVDLLAPVLEQCLHQQGWQALPSSLTRRAKLTWPNHAQLGEPYRALAENERSALRDEWRSATDKPQDALTEASTEEGSGLRARTVADAVKRLGPADGVACDMLNIHKVSEEILNEIVDEIVGVEGGANAAQALLVRLRSALHERYRQGHWTGPLPPLIGRARFVSPPITRVHVVASRFGEELRNWALSPHAASTDGDEIRLAKAAIAIATEGQVGTVLELISALQPATLRAAKTHPVDHLRLMIDISSAEDGVKGGRVLSAESATLAKRWLMLTKEEALTEKKIEQSLRKSLPAAWLKKQRGGALVSSLVDLGILGAQVSLPGMIWERLLSTDSRTIDTSRTLQLMSGTVEVARQEAGAEEQGDEFSDRTLEMAVAAEVKPSLRLAMKQYRLLRRTLWALSERADRQSVDHRRYSKAREYVHGLMVAAETPPNLRLLARYTAQLLSPTRSIRIKTVYSYLTNIGKRLLLAAGNTAVTGLDEEGLEDLFRRILDQVSSKKAQDPTLRGTVAIQLLGLYAANRDQLPDIDTTMLIKAAGGKGRSSGRVEIFGVEEHRVFNRVLIALTERGVLSRDEADQLCVVADQLFYLGNRIAESFHIRQRDAYRAGDADMLYVRSSAVGLLKTHHSRRLHNLGGLLPPASMRNHLRVLSARRVHESDGNSPLLLARYPGRLLQFQRILRKAVILVSNGRISSLHSLRHSCGSRLLLDLASQSLQLDVTAAPVSTYRVARVLGHSRPSVSIEHYWHLAHLAHAQVWRPALSEGQISLLGGVSKAAVRQRRRRMKSVQTEPAVAVPRLVPEPNTDQAVETVAKIISKHQRGTIRDLACALIGLRLGDSPSQIVSTTPASQKRLAAMVRVCIELMADRIVALVAPDTLSEFAVEIGLVEQMPRFSRVRIAPMNELTRRKLAVADLSWLEDLDERLLRTTIAASMLNEDQFDARHHEVMSRVPDSVRRSKLLPYLLAAAVIDARRGEGLHG